MNSEPTTPVRVPKAASTYTPTTQDPDLRSQINTILLRDGHISKIQESLLHALNASPTNWPTLIQDHALALLRSGDYTTFPALMTRVLDDIKADTAAARNQEEAKENGAAAAGTSASKPAAAVLGKGEGGKSLALPKSVVEEGVRITKECLDLVVEVE
ncbi:hypothetical protein OIDMADRAFT_157407 [Oidiodendron maius Zn]|uniref:Uncharacterized protein n=1 Tax=Oidiodendron maius (strain Zn) TaxID=913774 RepID=A0A0C3H9I0_OIDMZ|nr:hypothetical protein OIDMADRAFT_157407 [Oidiodendron maius Zn]